MNCNKDKAQKPLSKAPHVTSRMSFLHCKNVALTLRKYVVRNTLTPGFVGFM